MAAAAPAALIRLKETAVVDTPQVRLSEIAVIEGTGPVERARLGAVVVAYVHRDAASTEVRSDEVQEMLAAVGFNLTRITMAGSVATKVELASAGSHRTVSRAAERYLSAAAPGARFAVTALRLDFEPPDGFVPVVTAVRPAAAPGPVRFDVADAADPSVKVGHALANLEKSLPAVTARRSIAGGARISAGDVEIVYMPAGRASLAFRDASRVVGRRTVASLSQGEPLTPAHLEGEPAVRRGDEVVLAVEHKGLTVRLSARAQEDGMIGEVVRLRAARGRGEYLATVTGPGRARPIAGGGV